MDQSELRQKSYEPEILLFKSVTIQNKYTKLNLLCSFLFCGVIINYILWRKHQTERTMCVWGESIKLNVFAIVVFIDNIDCNLLCFCNIITILLLAECSRLN